MQPCEFSETQFSFCFTFEYIKQFFPFVPLPIFPNTVEEGRVGGGYDVKINGNIYFQFKIPTYHDLVSNFFRKHWNVFRHDYYKIKLETDADQFKFLKALQNPLNQVYYATPEFYASAHLENYYLSNSIVTHSALFSIDNFPAHGSGHHHLIYSPSHDWGKLFSKATEIKKIKSINPFELFSGSKSDFTIYHQALHIRNILRKQENKIGSDFPFNDNKPEQFVKAIYTVLLTKYNIHWYPVISWQQET